jgi:hypothetical protein
MAVGTFNLGDFAITTAGTYTGTSIYDLDGMVAANFQVRFSYASGGVSVRLFIQTTLDQGQTWVDIASFSFGTSSDLTMFGLSKLAADGTTTTPTDGALSADSVVNGVLGDELRCKYVVSGTYGGGTMLAVRASVS